ncbi:hypothetical protein ASE00_07225 [Sphingomonas sp. Root710]|uniref:response regulator n=1 Tax=Sphingomonas sp. Root710 TaxID=1736594 RepID=UPI0006FE1392|nr:response regulator transcription factor [Sphingomonas sp. Root710]KRB86482.1 hypothetical protein ASE00_07225 [Sphingomonas sp. Root710]
MTDEMMVGSRVITSNKRVLVVDDHPIVIYGLKLLLGDNENVTICGEANDVPSACQKVDDLVPDIVILDLILGGQDGIDLIRTLLKRRPDLLIIAYSCQYERVVGPRVLRAGARGFLSKVGGLREMEAAIAAVSKGDLFFEGRSRPGAGAVLAFSEAQAIDALSDREMQVLQLTGQGLSLQRIAQELSLSAKTVGTYRERLKIKLGVDRVQELVPLSRYLLAQGPAGNRRKS